VFAFVGLANMDITPQEQMEILGKIRDTQLTNRDPSSEAVLATTRAASRHAQQFFSVCAHDLWRTMAPIAAELSTYRTQINDSTGFLPSSNHPFWDEPVHAGHTYIDRFCGTHFEPNYLAQSNRSFVITELGIPFAPGAALMIAPRVASAGQRALRSLVQQEFSAASRGVNTISKPLFFESASGEVIQLEKQIFGWLGEGAKCIRNEAGDSIFLSKGGLRRVRFDFKNPSPHHNPHSHVEIKVHGDWIKSGPIYPTDVPHN
jgi:hypothetical protein